MVNTKGTHVYQLFYGERWKPKVSGNTRPYSIESIKSSKLNLFVYRHKHSKKLIDFGSDGEAVMMDDMNHNILCSVFPLEIFSGGTLDFLGLELEGQMKF